MIGPSSAIRLSSLSRSALLLGLLSMAPALASCMDPDGEPAVDDAEPGQDSPGGKADDTSTGPDAVEPSVCPSDGLLTPGATYTREYVDLDAAVRVVVRRLSQDVELEVSEGRCDAPGAGLPVVEDRSLATAAIGPGPAFCVRAINASSQTTLFGYQEELVSTLERQSEAGFGLGQAEPLPGNPPTLDSCSVRLGELTEERAALFTETIDYTYRCVGGSATVVEDSGPVSSFVKLAERDQLHRFFLGGFTSFPCPPGKAPVADTCAAVTRSVTYDEPVSCGQITSGSPPNELSHTWLFADFERLDRAVGDAVEAILPLAVEYRLPGSDPIVVNLEPELMRRTADDSTSDTYNYRRIDPEPPVEEGRECVVRYHVVTGCAAR